MKNYLIITFMALMVFTSCEKETEPIQTQKAITTAPTTKQSIVNLIVVPNLEEFEDSITSSIEATPVGFCGFHCLIK